MYGTGMPIFLCDVDDVLTDFTSRVIPLIKTVSPNWTMESCPGWDLFEPLTLLQKQMIFASLARPGFCNTLHCLAEARSALEELRKLGCTVHAVTAPNHFPYWAADRVLWLQDTEEQVTFTAAKQMVRGDFFLDDRPDHVVKWAAENPQGKAMLWSTSGNARLTEGQEYRVRSWDEVISVVQRRLS